MVDPLLALADELYALPLGEFTAARDALVKEHKSDKAYAARIKALRKPSLAAWVVNLLVRREAGQVEQVLEVGAALREAQSAMNGEELRALTRQRRQLTAAVTTRARALARGEGVKVTEAVAEQVESTLTAAMMHEDAATAVRSGLLVASLTATGMDDLDVSQVLAVSEALGFQPSETSQQPVARPELRVVPDPDADAKAQAAAEEAVAAARRDVDSAQQALDESAAGVEEATARSLQIQAEIEEVRRKIAELEESVGELEDEADENDEALAEAEAAREEAEEQLTSAHTALARAEQRLAGQTSGTL